MRRPRLAGALGALALVGALSACGGGDGGDEEAFCAAAQALGERVGDGEAATDAPAVLEIVNELLATAPGGAPLEAAGAVGDAVERLDPGDPDAVAAFHEAVGADLAPVAVERCDGLRPGDFRSPVPPPTDDPLDDLPFEDFPFEDLPLEDFPFEDFPFGEDDLPFGDDEPLEEGPEPPDDAPPLADELARGEAGTGDVARGGGLDVVLVGDGAAATITVFGLDGFDPTVTVRDEDGAVVAENDDITLGVVLDSRVEVDIPAGERWEAEVRAFSDAGTGDVIVTYD